MERAAALEKMKDVISDQLGVASEKISETSSFTEDLEADSLDLLQLITAFEDEFGVSIPDEDFEKIDTIADALDIIEHMGI